jgi:aldose 1-epimerase
MPDGRGIDLFTLRNRPGAVAEIMTYGGIVVALHVPDRGGTPGDVVLGYPTLDGYLADNRPYFGALIGRYGNRIGGGRFKLEGHELSLARNNGENHLHGGEKGFDRVVWTGSPVPGPDRAAVELRYESPDGEEGYPGNLSVKVTYALTDENALRIDYLATTDRITVCNLTHHGYFNLDGAGRGDILAHRLFIDADRFTPIDRRLITTGELRPVTGTPFDFTAARRIGELIEARDEQLLCAGGYDHNFVLNSGGSTTPTLAARLDGSTSGRHLEVLTTEPGLQFYSGNFLDGTITGKGGLVYGRRFGLCLETQHFPDSPNQPGFPSTLLRPGEEYRSTTIYLFSAA